MPFLKFEFNPLLPANPSPYMLPSGEWFQPRLEGEGVRLLASGVSFTFSGLAAPAAPFIAFPSTEQQRINQLEDENDELEEKVKELEANLAKAETENKTLRAQVPPAPIISDPNPGYVDQHWQDFGAKSGPSYWMEM